MQKFLNKNNLKFYTNNNNLSFIQNKLLNNKIFLFSTKTDQSNTNTEIKIYEYSNHKVSIIFKNIFSSK